VYKFSLLSGVCVIAIALHAANAQQLSVNSATAKSVELTWTGAAGTAAIERSSGKTFQKIGPAAGSSYTDTTIDPFGTYKYRINTAGKFSNEVTVGPPPMGVSSAAPAPKGSDPAKYGPATATNLDVNGDPLIAFEWVDSNGDGDQADTEIRFVAWDRASYQWKQPVRVVTTGPLADQGVNPMAIACDRSNGNLAILTTAGENLVYATSTDNGVTWKTAPVSNSNGTPRAVSMIVASGQAYAAVNAETGATYYTGSAADPSSFKSQAVPAGAGWKIQNQSNIPMTVDQSGNIALAFYVDQQDADNHRYVFWRAGSSDPTVIAANAPADSPDVALTFGGNKFGVLLNATLDSNDTDHGVWYTQSTDGSSWSKPVRLPIDGPRSTNPPLGIAIASKGNLTAAFGSNSGSAGATCNSPAVSRSTDGANWTTCGIGQAAGADFNPQPPTIHVIEAPNDKAYVVWQEQNDSKYNPGVLVWHEK